MQVLMTQEQLLLKGASPCVPAFCLNLLDFKKENNMRFLLMLFYLLTK